MKAANGTRRGHGVMPCPLSVILSMEYTSSVILLPVSPLHKSWGIFFSVLVSPIHKPWDIFFNACIIFFISPGIFFGACIILSIVMGYFLMPVMAGSKMQLLGTKWPQAVWQLVPDAFYSERTRKGFRRMSPGLSPICPPETIWEVP